MKGILHFVALVVSVHAMAQSDSLSIVKDIQKHQNTVNDFYRDPKRSPLLESDRQTFKGIPFFPISLEYRVKARLIRTDNTPFFGLATTTSRLAMNRLFGYLEFTLQGKAFRMPVYQSRDFIEKPGYADHLFFLFTDRTNGHDSYTGGRYIDLRVPEQGDEVIIDFNKSYNPYCAYNPRYSCPVVPAENDMDIEVRAGVSYKKK